ncbi:MAG: hypothetical protein KDD50_04330 [Bdellovibrionales bacterium]|nr:hypothetical protein [Bdellovibrionales bacterium]MCB0413533.1 hypothetical protein [Bdellovibrionales bacterium]
MTIIGGSAMVLGYESERMTSDCDPWGKAQEELLANWSEAQKVSGINLRIDEQTGVAQFPENFEDRLVEADLSLKKLTIKYPEKHDLALSKVVRLLGNDLDDIIWLHKNHKLDFKTFKARYYEEVRPIYIGDVSNLDFNFLDAVEELFGLEERQKCEKDSERI